MTGSCPGVGRRKVTGLEAVGVGVLPDPTGMDVETGTSSAISGVAVLADPLN